MYVYVCVYVHVHVCVCVYVHVCVCVQSSRKEVDAPSVSGPNSLDNTSSCKDTDLYSLRR